MATFENPHNGYRETVGGSAILFTLLFGCFYLAYKGAWGWAILSFFIVVFLGAFSFGVLGFIAWLCIAPFAPAMVRQTYLRRGWRQVDGAAAAA